MNSIIQIEHLTLELNNQVILNDVTVDFEEGQIHGIVGRNGSGKTMLMKCICGLVRVDSGTVIVNGEHMERGNKVPKSTGAIIETPGFLPQYSGFRNLKMLAALTGKASSKEIKTTMLTVGLMPDEKKPVGKYSLGMRQKLGLAQILMDDPDLLILDEPFNGLDEGTVTQMRKLFQALCEKGKTLLIATHNQEDILSLCHTVSKMENGILQHTEKI